MSAEDVCRHLERVRRHLESALEEVRGVDLDGATCAGMTPDVWFGDRLRDLHRLVDDTGAVLRDGSEP